MVIISKLQKVIMQYPLFPNFPYTLFSGVQNLSFTGGYRHPTFVHPCCVCSFCRLSEGSRCCREDLAPSAQLWRVPRAAEPPSRTSKGKLDLEILKYGDVLLKSTLPLSLTGISLHWVHSWAKGWVKLCMWLQRLALKLTPCLVPMMWIYC